MYTHANSHYAKPNKRKSFASKKEENEKEKKILLGTKKRNKGIAIIFIAII